MHWVAIVIILHNKLLWKLCFKIVIRYFHRSAGCVGSFASFLDLEVSWLVGPWLNGQQLLRVNSPHGSNWGTRGQVETCKTSGVQAQNWHTTISASFFQVKQIMVEIKDNHKINPCLFSGRSCKFPGQGVDSGKENGLTSSAVYHS